MLTALTAACGKNYYCLVIYYITELELIENNAPKDRPHVTEVMQPARPEWLDQDWLQEVDETHFRSMTISLIQYLESSPEKRNRVKRTYTEFLLAGIDDTAKYTYLDVVGAALQELDRRDRSEYLEL